MPINKPYDFLNLYNYNRYNNFSNCNKSCNVRTIACELVDDTLYLLLKRRIFTNGECFGLIICNNVPCGAGDAPVEISTGIGPDATSFPLLTTSGEPVLAYQLKTRCRIPVTVSTAESAFLVNPKYLCWLGAVLGGGAAATEEGGN